MAAEQEETALQILERNDPEVETIRIRLGDFLDADLAGALERNQWVDDLTVEFTGMDLTKQYPRFCDVIKTRGNLKYIRLDFDGLDGADFQPRATTPAWVVLGLIESIQGNSNIHGVSVQSLTNAGTLLCPLLKGTTTFRDLNMFRIQMSHAELVEFAAALQKYTKLETVYLSQLPLNHWLPILKALANNKNNLKNLHIVTLELEEQNQTFYDPRNVGAILQAIAKFRSLGSLLVYFSCPAVTALTNILPKIRAKLISATFFGNTGDVSDSKHLFLSAVERNFIVQDISLECISARTVEYSSMLSDADTERLQVYVLNRNKRYAEWIEKPTLLPIHLCPEAFALKAGPEPLYLTLQKILPKLLETYPKPSKKRKRPIDNDEDDYTQHDDDVRKKSGNQQLTRPKLSKALSTQGACAGTI